MPTPAIKRKSKIWNPWHGCHKLSAGCQHCYVCMGYSKRGVDSNIVTKTKTFDLSVQRKRNCEYKIPSETMVYTCFTSEWRAEAWEMMRIRSDLRFMMVTKRIDRLHKCVYLIIGFALLLRVSAIYASMIALIGVDWGYGYDNVTICRAVKNQDRVDYRLHIYKAAPIKHKIIICEPLLERIDLALYDIGSWVEQVLVGGESSYEALSCDFNWVMELHDLCVAKNVSFWFKQTGVKFIKDGKLYNINRRLQHSQARKAGINIMNLCILRQRRIGVVVL